MGALVAAVNKAGENVVPTVVSMLRELKHRGNDGHGIATPDSAITASLIEELELKDHVSSIALGHNLSCILPRDQPQPVQGNGFTAVFEGRTFPSPNLPDLPEVNEIVEMLGSNPLKNAGNIIEKLAGSYVFAFADSNKVIVGRDLFGVAPLYYGENDTVCAVASERKALWKTGVENVVSFPPGQLAVMDNHGFSFRTVKMLRMPPKETVDLETAARALQLLLLESTRKRVSDLEAVAVAFSGGVDSSVVAVLAEDAGLDVQLISVGLEGQREVLFAEKAAEALGLPLHLRTYTVGELERTLAEVLWLIEEPNPVNACIAVPFYWLAETAANLGYPVLLAGQGADELFGGYQRYLTEYSRSDAEAVEQKLFHDVENAYQANFQRDNHVCSYHRVELRLPFIDRDVVDFGLRLPLRLKINSVEDKLRKRVLRRVAHNLEIPSFMADKPKKAVQYTTGVTKALQCLAKDEGLTLRGYVKQAFSGVYPSGDGN
ncbi:MAG: asparagine synthetase B [Candidatus Bathyarchaeota archaeon]|jgi:asparagine synthase (glutamine-hydrolysing)